ncbi:MAG: colanic acid/amylovoran biosynthesis glycosyltransferase [Chthoniobacter sp.]|jgi:colanic acid/amylovoran biosynthesis glycosyltransferase|nr:colanic acid/amylovoran biosynthesis glycosyltransferase [Chthoniobacter sp.]
MPKPIVASYCTTFLKPEMLHIFRQVTGLRRYDTFVVAKERIEAEQFPFGDVEMMPRKPRKNFIRRFWLKHVRKRPALYYRGEFQGMMRIFRRRHADLMHIYFGHTGVHLLPFIKGWEKPCLVSFHGADVMLRPHQPEYEANLRELLQVSPLVLARSFSLRERLLALGCPPEKIRINRTGIPLDDFPLKQREAPADGAWRFVQACRLIPKKGLRTALRAFALFNQRFPKSRFVIAGDGPMKREIEELARELGIAHAVELRGFLTQHQLRALYAESHVFVHPSELTADQNQEGIPNSMLEAMSTGLPVLATLHGGIPEAVENGSTGLLTAERDHDALFQNMLRLAENPSQLFALGRAASASVHANFEHGAQIEKLESYYDEVRQIGKLPDPESGAPTGHPERSAGGGRGSSKAFNEPPPDPSTARGMTGGEARGGNSFAYLFERFPSFTQTFCFREVEEMSRQKMEPAVYSIRGAERPEGFPMELTNKVVYLPQDEALTKAVRAAREAHKIRSEVWETFNTWGDRGDKTRLYEAAWLGLELKRRGIRHVHVHFAGIAARTAWWIRKFWGISYSFTAHANDIFCETQFPVSLEDLVRDTRAVVTVSDFSREWLRDKFPRDAKKIHRVYNGIQVEKFPAAAFEDGIPKIVSVGRLIEKKGFSTLIDACALLRNRGTLFYCRIIGEGPLEAELRAQIGRLGLKQKVALEGPRTEEEVKRFLAGARVFALACTREADGGMDNLPTVIMEAMACGLPVVSTRLAGVPEMIAEGETGRIVRERDAAAFADALDTLLSKRDIARQFGQCALNLVRSKFSTAVTTRELKHLLTRYGRVRPSFATIKLEPKLLLKWLRLSRD